MIATNHMLAGAVVATAVQQPLLVALLAVASHFVLDMVPHFGVHEDKDPVTRNRNPWFQFMLALDLTLVAALLVLLPFVMHGVVSPWILLAGMVLAWIPDSVWVHHFIRTHRGHTKHSHGRISRFHQRIQWFERPIGITVEILFFGGAAMLLGLNLT